MNTLVRHASPAGVYGHVSDRDFEDDSGVIRYGCNPNDVDDLAEQLVHGDVGKKLKVIFGGGARGFINQTIMENGMRGQRRDGKNLIEEWKNLDSQRTYVNSRQQLMDLNEKNVKQVLGLFQNSHMNYNLDTVRNNQEELYPTLKEMTEKAIDILSQNENGYFLFVEGGRIDHGRNFSIFSSFSFFAIFIIHF